MTTKIDWRDIFQDIDAKECPKCRALALIAEPSDNEDRLRLVHVHEGARFCFECGYQDSPVPQS